MTKLRTLVSESAIVCGEGNYTPFKLNENVEHARNVQFATFEIHKFCTNKTLFNVFLLSYLALIIFKAVGRKGAFI